MSQVAGALSLGPKHPHGAERPRATADATTIVKSTSITAATVDDTVSNSPVTRYIPSNISNGGSASAIAATTVGGSPSR